MNPRTQGLLIGLAGSVLLRLASSAEYLRYVNPWMRWPLLATAAVLLGLGLRLLSAPQAPREHTGSTRGPWSAWLLVLPVLAVFAVSPPALGAYAADRSAVKVTTDKNYGTLGGGPVVPMSVSEFQGRAQWDDTLSGATVALTGFVSTGPDGAWYLTRLAIACCAADAVAYKVRIEDAPLQPPQDAWVRVTGTWQKPATTALPRLDPPVLKVTDVTPVATPSHPYE